MSLCPKIGHLFRKLRKKKWYKCTFANGPQMGMLAFKDSLHTLQQNHSSMAPTVIFGQPFIRHTFQPSAVGGDPGMWNAPVSLPHAWSRAGYKPGGDEHKGLQCSCCQRFCLLYLRVSISKIF